MSDSNSSNAADGDDPYEPVIAGSVSVIDALVEALKIARFYVECEIDRGQAEDALEEVADCKLDLTKIDAAITQGAAVAGNGSAGSSQSERVGEHPTREV